MISGCEVNIFNSSINLKDNAMLKVRPDLFNEWDFCKNEELGLDIYLVTRSSNKKAWWRCLKCHSTYNKRIKDKAVRNYGCTYCAGRKVNNTNSLAKLNPKLASEWHPTRNVDLTPHNVTCGSNKKVWWICDNGHEYESQISNRTIGDNCPFCSGHRVWVGYNDIWTTDPNLAKLLLNPEDGFKYSKGSCEKVNWKCPDCGEIIKSKKIQNIKNQGLPCPVCSDGISYPEKAMYHLLKHNGVDFIWEKIFDWSRNKRYDFYLVDFNIIIEMHGRQHYDGGFEYCGGKNLNDEIDNDDIKYNLALENGINDYIVINSSVSNIDYLKDNIMKSTLSNYINLENINWDKINSSSLKSLIIHTCELWDTNLYSVKELTKILKLSNTTIRTYLNIGNKMGICKYIGNKKEVVQFSTEDAFIRKWDSISEASIHIGIPNANIIKCCKRERNTAGGYKWMYKSDYDSVSF